MGGERGGKRERERDQSLEAFTKFITGFFFISGSPSTVSFEADFLFSAVDFSGEPAFSSFSDLGSVSAESVTSVTS